MSGRHFGSMENAELRTKINEAKRRLPLPELMSRLGLAAHANKSARCPFPEHEDKHPSFSVFKGEDGFWHYNCFSKCGDGDEIMFLRKLRGLSLSKAMNLYLEMAGFPASRPPKSREYLKSPKSLEHHKSPESPGYRMYPVYPVSKRQGLEKELKGLAARNACTERNTARSRRWQLVRDLRVVEKGIGRELDIRELMPVFDEWFRLSHPFLDPTKTRDAYLAKFLAELPKVRVPTGEADTLNKAVERVSTFSPPELPMIPDYPDAPESWRRVAALHRELSSGSTRKNKTYFLSYRDAAKADSGLSHQLAYDITLAFDRLGIIKIADKGKAGPNGGKAAEFQYLLPPLPNGSDQKQQ
jgi:CHC2 zinc finger